MNGQGLATLKFMTLPHPPSGCGSPQSNRLLHLVHKNVGLLPVKDPHVKEMIECFIVKTMTIQHPVLLGRPQCVRPQGIVIVKFRHRILLPASLFCSIPLDLTSADYAVMHPFRHLYQTLDCGNTHRCSQ